MSDLNLRSLGLGILGVALIAAVAKGVGVSVEISVDVDVTNVDNFSRNFDRTAPHAPIPTLRPAT